MGADAESFHSLFHDQSGDSLVAQGLVCHTENDEDVCIACVCDEDLGAVYQIVVALVFENSLLACCVSTCVGLGQTESTELLAAQKLGKILCLLLFGTELVDRPGAKGCVSGNADSCGSANLGYFLDALCIGELVQSCSAVFLGERNTHEAHLCSLLEGLYGEFLLFVDLSSDGSADSCSEIAIQGDHLFMNFVVKKVHCNLL